MRDFRYRAITADSRYERGRVTAASREDAVRHLITRGSYPTVLKESRRRAGPQLSQTDLHQGLTVLSGLLAAGIPLEQALNALETMGPSSWIRLLTPIREHIRDGGTLSSALEAADVSLRDDIGGIIRVGEERGAVSDALRRASASIEASLTSRREVQAALTYPAILAMASGASLALMLSVVVPRFQRILEDLGQELPATLSFLLWLTAAARGAALPLILVGTGGIIAWRIWMRRSDARRRWHEALLRVPALGPLRHQIASAQAMDSIAGMLRSGITFVDAIDHAVAASGDAAVGARLLMLRQALIHGTSVADALATAKPFTPGATFLLAAGASSGDLAGMAEHAARLEHEHYRRSITASIRLIEPTLILIFALLVGLVSAAMLQGVYSIRPVP